MRTIALSVLGTLLLAPQLALAGDDLNTPPPPPDAIGGGEPANTCAFPTVCRSNGCTGNLIHPRIVISAAHCGTPGGFVFSEASQSFSVPTEQCWVNPGYDDTPSTDWAICTLAQEVNLPVTPILYGCEVDMLQPGTPVLQIGFGATSDAGGFGVKYWVQTSINAVYDAALSVGGNGKGACPGDSGGPLLVQLEDGSFRQAGITSTYQGTCGSVNTYARADRAVQWFESVVGMDLTPCHDTATGAWDPSTECTGFFAGDPQGSGTWSDGGPCLGTPASGASDSCGDPLGHDDEDAPTVAITYPADGDYFETAPAPIDVTVDASDGDGSGVIAVWLEIDGNAQPFVVEEEPYVFPGVNFPEGAYTIVAVAEDFVHHEGRSEEVTIYVGVEPPPPEDTDTGDTGLTDGESGGTGGGSGGPNDDGSDGDSGSGSGVGEDDSDSKGCGCTTPGPAAPTWGLALLGLFACWRRPTRRRRRA